MFAKRWALIVLLLLSLFLVASASAPQETIALRVMPTKQYGQLGERVAVEIYAEGPTAAGYEVHLDYDPEILELAGLAFGDYMDDVPSIEVGPLAREGRIAFGQANLLLTEVQPPSSLLATLEFTATAPGTSVIAFITGSTVFYSAGFESIATVEHHGAIQISPSCRGDYVEPWGVRNFADILQFLRYFKAGDHRADLNRDGALTKADIEEMVALWGTTCD